MSDLDKYVAERFQTLHVNGADAVRLIRRLYRSQETAPVGPAPYRLSSAFAPEPALGEGASKDEIDTMG